MGCSNSTVTKQEIEKLKTKIKQLEEEKIGEDRKNSNQSQEMKNLNKQVSLKKEIPDNSIMEKRQINSFSPSSWQPSVNSNTPGFKSNLEVSEIKKSNQLEENENSEDSILVIKEVVSNRKDEDEVFELKNSNNTILKRVKGSKESCNETKKLKILEKDASKMNMDETDNNQISQEIMNNPFEETSFSKRRELKEEKFSIHINGVLLCEKKVKFRPGSKTEGVFKKRKHFIRLSNGKNMSVNGGTKKTFSNILKQKTKKKLGETKNDSEFEKVKYILAKGFKMRKKIEKKKKHVIVQRSKESMGDDSISISIKKQILANQKKEKKMDKNKIINRRRGSKFKNKSFKISSITGSKKSSSIRSILDEGRVTPNSVIENPFFRSPKNSISKTEPPCRGESGLNLEKNELDEFDVEKGGNKEEGEKTEKKPILIKRKRKKRKKTQSLGERYLEMLKETKKKQVSEKTKKQQKKEISEESSLSLDQKIAKTGKDQAGLNRNTLENFQDKIIGDLKNRSDTPNPALFTDLSVLKNVNLDNKDKIWRRQNTRAPKLVLKKKKSRHNKKSLAIESSFSQIDEGVEEKLSTENKSIKGPIEEAEPSQSNKNDTSFNNFWGNPALRKKNSQATGFDQYYLFNPRKQDQGNKSRKIKIMPLKNYNKKLKEIFKKRETSQMIEKKHRKNKQKPRRNNSFVLKKKIFKSEDEPGNFNSVKISKKKKAKSIDKKKHRVPKGYKTGTKEKEAEMRKLEESSKRVMKLDLNLKNKMAKLFGNKKRRRSDFGLMKSFQFRRSQVFSIDEQKRKLKEEGN